jgi:hypothetical protein
VELGGGWHAANFFELGVGVVSGGPANVRFLSVFFGREAEFFWRISLQFSVKMHILMKDFTSTHLTSSCGRPPGRIFFEFLGTKIEEI